MYFCRGMNAREILIRKISTYLSEIGEYLKIREDKSDGQGLGEGRAAVGTERQGLKKRDGKLERLEQYTRRTARQHLHSLRQLIECSHQFHHHLPPWLLQGPGACRGRHTAGGKCITGTLSVEEDEMGRKLGEAANPNLGKGKEMKIDGRYMELHGRSHCAAIPFADHFDRRFFLACR